MRYVLFTLFAISIISCKQQEATPKIEEKEKTVAEKIAEVHGFEHWQNVKSFEFRFGGKIEEPNSGRAWKWNPKTADVAMMSSTDTISYNRNAMDSLALKTDPAFINDKFWALIPFQLIWDEGVTISDTMRSQAPVSKKEMLKLTMTYGSEGGYSPGDAYDLYIDNNFVIREWSFRKGNAAEPSLSNTFENYNDYNGIKVAQDHKFGEGDRNLLIRNVKVSLED